jgi:arylsulfatase A-like enzyme
MGNNCEKKPNILLFGIDSLRRDHMGCYGYQFNTTPHIGEFAELGTLFENSFSPHVPTTPGYSNMLTGMDCFGTNVVALGHQGDLREGVRTLPEILREHGYTSTCVGFRNVASRGFDTYLEFDGWGASGDGYAHKAEGLNKTAIPELERLAAQDQPWLLFLRHMDPHTPYLPPSPFERMFYGGNELDPANHSMEPVFNFKPFSDYFASWMPKGLTDKDYEIAQYDGAVAYMDACIQNILIKLEALGLMDDTIVVFTADHGETLYDHECWFDHHGTYDCTLVVPMIIVYPRKMPAGERADGFCQLKDLVPTLLELAEIEVEDQFDGHSLLPMATGEVLTYETELYITECTWMRKHGWRTPEWKLIVALEPDFHFKPPVELYNLLEDPEENNNLAEELPDVVAFLRGRMEAFIARRTAETGLENPMYTQSHWKSFASSQEAYNTLHIGNPSEAAKLQRKD